MTGDGGAVSLACRGRGSRGKGWRTCRRLSSRQSVFHIPERLGCLGMSCRPCPLVSLAGASLLSLA